MHELQLRINKSKISGYGVFTNNSVSKGQTVCFLEGDECNLDELIRKVASGEEEASDSLQIDNEMYIDLDELPRTINHSCNPNCFIRGNNELVALRGIKPGEEITYDYSTTMDDNKEKIFKILGREPWSGKCTCRSQNCRGIIGQFSDIPEDTRKHIIDNKWAPDFILKKFGRL